MPGEQHSDYWQLPGPQQYLDEILSALGQNGGQNVLLCRPRHAPLGLAQALQARCQSHPLGAARLEFHQLALVEPGTDPLAELCRVLGIREAECEDIPALLRHAACQRKLFFVELAEDSVRWSQWKTFLPQYAHAYRSRPVPEPSPICTVVSGPLGQGVEALSDVALRVQYEYGVCQLYDMVAYAAHRLRKYDLTPLQRQIAVAYAAHLSLWDPEVCDRLTNLPWPGILEPAPILRKLAAQRQWANKGLDANWYDGSEDCFGGVDRMHSAFLLDAPEDEIHRRLFCAQLTVLLPHIEHRRPHLLKTLDRMLKVPYHDKDGRRVDEKHRLEVGHIENQLRDHDRNRRTTFRSDTRKEVNLLLEVRNALSHLNLFDHGRLSELEPRHPPKEERRLRERRPRC